MQSYTPICCEHTVRGNPHITRVMLLLWACAQVNVNKRSGPTERLAPTGCRPTERLAPTCCGHAMRSNSCIICSSPTFSAQCLNENPMRMPPQPSRHGIPSPMLNGEGIVQTFPQAHGMPRCHATAEQGPAPTHGLVNGTVRSYIARSRPDSDTPGFSVQSHPQARRRRP